MKVRNLTKIVVVACPHCKHRSSYGSILRKRLTKMGRVCPHCWKDTAIIQEINKSGQAVFLSRHLEEKFKGLIAQWNKEDNVLTEPPTEKPDWPCVPPCDAVWEELKRYQRVPGYVQYIRYQMLKTYFILGKAANRTKREGDIKYGTREQPSEIIR